MDEVRKVLLGGQQGEIVLLREHIDELTARVHQLEVMLAETDGRTESVREVLVDAVQDIDNAEPLGLALRPEVEHAVHVSARQDSAVLAAALYPVMGPAIRKMIAELFTFDNSGSGNPFVVDQVLLIDRTSGLLLAASMTDEAQMDDADVVSGMLDAIRLFVQDAFDAADHDGLRDLRVGNTAVLVEWGPRAVLASVVRGVATDGYRAQAAETLELLHLRYAEEFADFDGNVEAFDPAAVALTDLRTSAASKAVAKGGRWRSVALVVVIAVLLILVGLWIF